METAVIKFHHSEILTAKENGKVYVALKPIVDGMGLEWARQSDKVKSDDRFNYRLMYMVAKDGKTREMGSLRLDQLAGFLYSINPNKVKAELKDKIIAFQKETFNVINDYWNKGYVSKSGDAPMSSEITQALTIMAQGIQSLAKNQEIMLELMRSQKASVQNVTYNKTTEVTLRDDFASKSEEAFVDAVFEILADNQGGLGQSEILRKLGRLKSDRAGRRLLMKYNKTYWKIAPGANNSYIYTLLDEETA